MSGSFIDASFPLARRGHFDDQVRFHNFPLTGVDPMCASTARSFPRHTHDQYGIGVIDSGAHRSWSDRGLVEAGPGELISVNPGEVHDGRPIDQRPRSWRLLYLDVQSVKTANEELFCGTAASFTFAAPVFTSPVVRRLFNQVFSFAAATVRPQETLACETAFIELLVALHQHSAGRPRCAPSRAPGIQRPLSRINDEPAARLSLAELAAEGGMSRYQLIRAFVRQLGMTPHAYILQRRIAMARRLIKAGHKLAEVALACGFCDQSHLNRCFMRHFGLSPRRYRCRTA